MVGIRTDAADVDVDRVDPVDQLVVHGGQSVEFDESWHAQFAGGWFQLESHTLCL